MSLGRRPLFVLLGVLSFALLLRVSAYALHPAFHPDSFFQYLEPAWWHLHGYGWQAWEWGAGLRSWIVPTYYGSWMVLLGWCGVRSGGALHDFFLLHWCVLSLLAVVAAERSARLLVADDASTDSKTTAERAGLAAALLTATFAPMCFFAPQTLVESPALLFMLWGFVWWLKARMLTDREATAPMFVAGLLLCTGALLRIPHGPLAAFVAFETLARGRVRALLALALGALGPLALFAVVDWITWGEPLHSSIAYVKYNFIENRQRDHGNEPADWYVQLLWNRGHVLGLGLAALLLLGLARSWPLAIPAIGVVAYLSTQALKQERFVVVVYPLAFAAVAATLVVSLRRIRSDKLRTLATAFAALWVLAFVIQSWRSTLAGPKYDYSDHWGQYEAESWVGAQGDASGLLIGDRMHLHGGYFRIGKNLPLAFPLASHVGNRMFNYAIARQGSRDAGLLRQRGFRPMDDHGDGWLVFKRN